MNIQRVQKDWTKIAGEPVEVERINDTFYGFCSELGTLRLFYKYRYSGDKAKAGWSQGRDSHYFRLEI